MCAFSLAGSILSPFQQFPRNALPLRFGRDSKVDNFHSPVGLSIDDHPAKIGPSPCQNHLIFGNLLRNACRNVRKIVDRFAHF